MSTGYLRAVRRAALPAVLLAVVSGCGSVGGPVASPSAIATTTPTAEVTGAATRPPARPTRPPPPTATPEPAVTPEPLPPLSRFDFADHADRIKVGDAPEAALVAYDDVWVANHRGGSMSRIDPTTNEVVTIPFRPGDRVGNVVFTGDGGVWFDLNTAVARVDAETNDVTVIPTGQQFRTSGGAAFAAGKLWVYAPPFLTEYDPQSGEEGETFRIGSFEPESRMTFGAGSLWIAEAETGLHRFDPEARKVIATIDDIRAYKVVTDGEWVWTVDEGGGTVALVDTETNTVGEPVRVRDTPGGILPRPAGDHLWVVLSDSAGVVLVDRESNAITGRWRSPDMYAGYAAVGYDSLWLPVFHRGEVWRLDLQDVLASR